jgi:hypothetical protein
VYPCKASIATILPPAYSGAAYYAGFDANKDMVFINLTEANVKSADRSANRFTLELPIFSNNNHTLCPLTYRLSSTKDSYTSFDELDAPVVKDETFEITVPFTHGVPSDYQFFIEAYNKDDTNAFTSKIVIVL